MAQDEVVIVDPQGTEHVFPAGFDPQKAAAIVKNSLPLSEPTTYGEGFKRSLEKTASDTGAGIVQGIGNALNPINLAKGAYDVITGVTDPASLMIKGYQQAPQMAAGLKTIAKGDPNAGGQAIGGLLTSLAVPPIMKGAGRLMQWAAPQAMDMGLQRTMADRLEFPNTPQRLVDEGIIPHGQNVQKALTATEDQVNLRSRLNPNPTIDPKQIAQEASDYAENAGKMGGLGNVPGPEQQDLTTARDTYLARQTQPMTAREAIEQKRAYQARGSYNNRPNAPTVTNEQTNFNKGIAAATRNAAIQINPKLAEDLAKEQDLLGALSAVEKMGAKATPLSTVGTAKTILGLRNPTIMGTAGIGLDRAGQALQGISPEVVRAALLDLMRSHGEP